MGAFSASRLDSPPPAPPDVGNQMGTNPMSGISSMLADKYKKDTPPGDMESVSSVHPQGAVLALFDTIKKAAQQLSRMDPNMAPFVERSMSILERGVGESISKSKPQASAPDSGSEAGATPMGGASKAPSNESSRSFPG